MKESKHWRKDRKERASFISEIGEGKVVYSTFQFDEKRQRWFQYEITDHAILIVKSAKGDYIITKMPARPSRIKKYWNDAPQDILEMAIGYSRNRKAVK